MPNASESTSHLRAAERVLVACDKSVLPVVNPILASRGRSVEHVTSFSAASEKANQQRYDVIMVEILFDGGARLFDFLRVVRRTSNAETRIICFRGERPRLEQSNAADTAIASVARLIANAEFCDLSKGECPSL